MQSVQSRARCVVDEHLLSRMMQTAVAVGAAGVLVTGVATGRVHPHTVAVGLGVVGAAAAAWLAIVKATLERLHASVRACGEDVQPTDRTACVMHLPSINTRCMFLFLLTTYMNVCVCDVSTSLLLVTVPYC